MCAALRQKLRALSSWHVCMSNLMSYVSPAQCCVASHAACCKLFSSSAQLSGMHGAQIGLACVQQPLPIWIRGQTPIHMRPVQCMPAGLVRLAPGSEVSIAPRPRKTVQQAVKPQQEYAQAAQGIRGMHAEGGRGPVTWLRLQVGTICSRHA